MASSDFLLNVKLLGGPNFDSEQSGKIAAMIASQQHGIERSGAAPNETINLIGSDGRDVEATNIREGKKFSVGSDVADFAKNINWLCQRTALYSLLSASMNGIAVLHPVRSSFSLSLAVTKLGLPDIMRRRIIEALKSPAGKILIEIKTASDPTAVALQLPLFTAWIASRGAAPDQFFDEAQQLKETRHVAALRSKFSELEEIDCGGNGKKYAMEVNRLVQAIVSASDIVRSEFAITTANGPSLSPLVAVANAGLAIHGAPVSVPDFGIRLPTSLSTGWKTRGYRGIFRSVISDLASVAKLGELHEKVTRNVRRIKDAQFKEVKVEPPHLRYAKPYWKRPM